METTDSGSIDHITGKTSTPMPLSSPTKQELYDKKINPKTNFGWYITATIIAILIMAIVVYLKPVF